MPEIDRRTRIVYVVLYSLGLAWFAGYLFFSATRPENQNAGVLVLAEIFAVGLAPCAILWTLRRLFTGRWL